MIQTIKPPSPEIFEQLNEIIANDIIIWLKEQGHEFEGQLEASIKIKGSLEEDSYIISADGIDYIFDLEYGVSPQDMQRKDINVEKLDRWVKFRRSQGHQVPGVNRLIKKWSEQGFELPGALSFSHKLKVNLAITDTFKTNDTNYFEHIDDIVFNVFDSQVFELKSGRV